MPSNDEDFIAGAAEGLQIRSPVLLQTTIGGDPFPDVRPHTPLDIALPPGKHLVELNANGRLMWRRLVTVAAGGQRVVDTTRGEFRPGTDNVVIGALEWTARDLEVAIPHSAPPGDQSPRMYNYPDVARLAPPGFRVPSKSDWLSLVELFDRPVAALTIGGSSNFNCKFHGYWIGRRGAGHMAHQTEARYFTADGSGLVQELIRFQKGSTWDWATGPSGGSVDFYSARYVREAPLVIRREG